MDLCAIPCTVFFVELVTQFDATYLRHCYVSTVVRGISAQSCSGGRQYVVAFLMIIIDPHDMIMTYLGVDSCKKVPRWG